MTRRVIAIAAHPDDIEFVMAGTLVLLRRAGWETHYLSVASGNCGSADHDSATTRRIRRAEARKAAQILGARHHRSLCDDLEILYELPLLKRLASVIREVEPAMVLTHSPRDYMADHVNTCRLAVTAAFAHGMRNFRTTPSRPPTRTQVTIYHALPHGLCDELGTPVAPGGFVDTTPVQRVKRAALEAHESQRSWLATSQGIDSNVAFMEKMSRDVGRMSGRFTHAEGWQRHSHLGLCAEHADPLREALQKSYLVNRAYARQLRRGH